MQKGNEQLISIDVKCDRWALALERRPGKTDEKRCKTKLLIEREL